MSSNIFCTQSAGTKAQGSDEEDDTGHNTDSVYKCGICYETYNNGDNKPGVLPCGHGYCCSCLYTWLRSKSSCPCCRKDPAISIDNIPVNYTVLDFLRYMKLL
jgi:hypothetical protein